MAREACVRAEDARVIALRAERAEADANDRAAAAARESAERAKADAARLKAEEESRERAQAEKDRAAAEQSKADALAAAEVARNEKNEALQAKQEADAARQAAIQQQQQLANEADAARQAAADAERMRMKAEQDQAQLRQQLLEQFNTILQTRDTARGLIVNMSDVLFDFDKYTLKPGAREKLAKVRGNHSGHPGLKMAVEGHTDSIGSDEYNMKLSENRADTVRDFLVSQGIDSGNITAQGFGKTMPVADNGTAAGRQMNRRVELVVSGEILGAPISSIHTGSVPNGKN